MPTRLRRPNDDGAVKTCLQRGLVEVGDATAEETDPLHAPPGGDDVGGKRARGIIPRNGAIDDVRRWRRCIHTPASAGRNLASVNMRIAIGINRNPIGDEDAGARVLDVDSVEAIVEDLVAVNLDIAIAPRANVYARANLRRSFPTREVDRSAIGQRIVHQYSRSKRGIEGAGASLGELSIWRLHDRVIDHKIIDIPMDVRAVAAEAAEASGHMQASGESADIAADYSQFGGASQRGVDEDAAATELF